MSSEDPDDPWVAGLVEKPALQGQVYAPGWELIRSESWPTDTRGMLMSDLQTAPESLFWYWISERHAIFLRRAAGLPKPWTEDPILQHYKFTNPFRENDRGTVWLRENFLEPHAMDHTTGHPEDCAWLRAEPCDCGRESDVLGQIAFNICWYRMFNWWGTGELLGWQTSWDPIGIKMILTDAKDDGEQVFTGAHIVYSRPGRTKIDAIVDVCSDLYHMCFAAGALVTCAREEKSLEAVYNGLRQVDSVGGFMAYEMVSDMRHTRLLSDAADIYTWANLGPGAKRGLTRLGLPCKNQDEGCDSMFELLQRSYFIQSAFEGLKPFDGLTFKEKEQRFPVFEMRDIEHSLCEFDKYCRVKFGEGEPRSKFDGA